MRKHEMTQIIFRAAVLACSFGSLFDHRASAQTSAAFEAFGGKPGVYKIADLGINRVLADPRINAQFTNANIPHLKAELGEQFCALLGGPCTYTGRDMRSAHGGMGLQDKDFNALAEDFQGAMDEAGVPFRYQNVLLAKLAPMEKDIVSKK
jgi:hemoglobin